MGLMHRKGVSLATALAGLLAFVYSELSSYKIYWEALLTLFQLK